MENNSCCICWETVDVASVFHSSTKILTTCKNYLQNRITFWNNFNVGYEEDSMPMMCSDCHTRSTELFRVHTAVEDMHRELNEMVDAFCEEILHFRSKLPNIDITTLVKEESVEISEAFNLESINLCYSDTKDSIDVSHEVEIPPQSPTWSPDENEANEIQCEIVKIEPLVKTTDSISTTRKDVQCREIKVTLKRLTAKQLVGIVGPNKSTTLSSLRPRWKSSLVPKKADFENNAVDLIGARDQNLNESDQDFIIESSDKIFKCRFCTLSFPRRSLAVAHRRSHYGNFKCPDCKKEFRHKPSLENHLKVCKRLLYGCDKCEQRFKTQDILDAHSVKHNEQKEYKCRECERSFMIFASLKLHEKKHLKELPFECAMCHKKFHRLDLLTIHTRTHTGEKPFTCSKCDKRYPSKSQRNYHMKSAHSEKGRNIGEGTLTKIHPHQCPSCDKSFRQHTSLERHIYLSHSQERLFGCDECGKRFKTEAQLRRHLDAVHTGLKPYQCDHCGKCFAEKQNLMVHKLLHGDSLPFECQLCNKKFHRKEVLTRHMHIHNGERPYICHKCGKTYLTKSQVNEHIRSVHEKGYDPAFQCNICDRRLKSQICLTAHLKRHYREKNLLCPHCDKSFILLPELKSHVKSHDKKLPCLCSFCGTRFSNEKGRRRHQLSHKGEKNLQSTICDKTFLTTPNLRIHTRSHNIEDKRFQCLKCKERFSINSQLKKHTKNNSCKTILDLAIEKIINVEAPTT